MLSDLSGNTIPVAGNFGIFTRAEWDFILPHNDIIHTLSLSCFSGLGGGRGHTGSLDARFRARRTERMLARPSLTGGAGAPFLAR